MAAGQRAPSNTGNTRAKSRHAAHRHREPYAWLGAGAITIGVGAALATGAGVAHADSTGSAGSESSSHTKSAASSANNSLASNIASTTLGHKPPRPATSISAAPHLARAKQVTPKVTETSAAVSRAAARAKGTHPTAPGAATGLGDALAYAVREIGSTLLAIPASATSAQTGAPVAGSAAVRTPPVGATEPPTNYGEIAENFKSALDIFGNVFDLNPVALAANIATYTVTAGKLDAYSGLLLSDAVDAGVNFVNALPQVIAYVAGPNAAIRTALAWASAAVEDVALAGVAVVGSVAIADAAAVVLTVGTVGYIGYTAYQFFNHQGTTATPGAPDTPVPGAPAVGTADPTTGVVTGTAVFTDPAGAPLTYSVTTNPTQGSITNFDSTTGDFTYTPNQDATVGTLVAGTPIVNTPDADTGVVTGSAVYTTTITDSFTVTASNGVHTATEVIPIATSLNAGSNLTYTLTTAPTLGAVTVNDDGTFTYTPSAAARQAALTNPITDTFTVTADPRVITGTNSANSATETITVPISAADPIVGTWTGNVASGGDSMAYAGGGVYTITHLTGDVWGTFTQTGPGAYAGHATIVDFESFTMLLNSDGTELTVDETVSLNGQVISASAILTKV